MEVNHAIEPPEKDKNSLRGLMPKAKMHDVYKVEIW